MKNTKVIVAVIIAIIITVIGCKITDNTDSNATPQTAETHIETSDEPLNITVLLDLSDRIVKMEGQEARDTAIVNYLFNKIIEKGQFTQRKDAFQVIFYPTPENHLIDDLSTTLSLNLSQFPALQKRNQIISFRQTLAENVPMLYSDAKNSGNWIGCDIWGLFNQEDASALCVKPGFRNILVILTDGYIYHKENKQRVGNNYSYILDQTLSNPNARLISCPPVQNLEVLIMECNPSSINKFPAMRNVLSEWLQEMNISHYSIHKTDNIANARTFIDNFIDNSN